MYVEGNWIRVKNACRTTVNKLHTDNNPTNEFKSKILISEHSPIRLIKVNWLWSNIKSWISVHFARHHIGFEKWISTQRDDRTGIDRNKSTQDTLVNMEAEANAQALINISKVRLCYGCPHKETREYMEDLKLTLKETEPELADVLVPNCIYRGGCPEFEPCQFWSNFIKDKSKDELANIKTRYNLYNEWFYNKHEK